MKMLTKEKSEDEKSSMTTSSKKRSAHYTHKNKLSCLSDVFSYELDSPTTKKIENKLSEINDKIGEFGK